MKKSFAIDIPSMVFALIAAFSLWWAHFIFDEGSSGGISVCIFVLLIALLYVALTPLFYIADENGLTVYYTFFLKDYYAWEDVKHIKEVWKYRVVYYTFETKERTKKYFFMKSEFHKSFVLKRIIKKYWQGEIEGDDWENMKKKIHAWKQKHNTFVPDNSEAEKAEREARKKIREIINLYKAGAEADNKFIKAIYLYETKSRECNNRPKESYSYNVEIEIGKIGYSDDESLYILSEILFVRYGKKSIKVMTDETVYSQISEKLSEAIEK